MKLTILAALLTSVTAFAMPKVGDTAVYDIMLELNGKKQAATSTYELTAFDAAAKKYTQKVTTVVGTAAPKVQEAQVEEANLLTDEAVADLLAHCADNKGTLAKVKVAAGEYDTCAVQYDEQEEAGTVWIGNVSFGVVKQEAVSKSNGMKIAVSLKSSK